MELKDNSFKIINYQKKFTDDILKLWNDDIGFIYPIDLEMYNQKINDCKYIDFGSSFVAILDEKIVGFILTKIYDNNEIITKYYNTAWISLFFVKRNHRRIGIGNNLLDKCEEELKKKGIISVVVGSDIDNFFPGIPNDFDNLTDIFFKKRGFSVSYYTHDLVHEIIEKDKTYADLYPSYYIENGVKKNVEIRYATLTDEKGLLDFLRNCFYGRWYYEGLEYYQDKEIKREYLIAIVDNKVVGFLRVNNQLIKKISYNITWAKRFKKLSGFGPLGVDINYRHHGIAKMLLAYAISDCYKNGYSHLMIDWTGLVTYYQKFGFEIWKCYQYAKKDLQ